LQELRENVKLEKEEVPAAIVKKEKEEGTTKVKKETSVRRVLKKKTDGQGNEYVDIGRSRRVVLSEYRGKKLLHIREYYEDENGDMQPSKRGIALSQSEWNNLRAVAGQFNF
jgi:hypothetical protein